MTVIENLAKNPQHLAILIKTSKFHEIPAPYIGTNSNSRETKKTGFQVQPRRLASISVGGDPALIKRNKSTSLMICILSSGSESTCSVDCLACYA